MLDHLLRRDELTIVLASLLIPAVALYYWAQPSSLVHPLLLGRQSDVARVRKPGQSAIYRNFSTGAIGELPSRPSKDVRILADLLKPDFTQSRSLWGTQIANETLQSRSDSLARGLLSECNLVPKESNVLLLLNDGLDWLLTDLALSKACIPSFTLTSLKWLAPILDNHPPSAIITHASFVPQLLELIADNNELNHHHTLIILGEDEKSNELLKYQQGLKVFRLEDVEESGQDNPPRALPVPQSTDILTVSFYDVQANKPVGTQLTHENVVAGVTATRFMVPVGQALSPADTIYSSRTMAGAMGRAIAYTALYEGANFTSFPSAALISPYNLGIPGDVSDLNAAVSSGDVPLPTVLFVNRSHIEAISSDVLRSARSRLGFQLGLLHKLFHIHHGYLSRDTVWDSLFYAPGRKEALGRADLVLRAVVVTELLPDDAVIPARVSLGLPLVFSFTHPLVCGPVLASHPLDLQNLPRATAEEKYAAPVGPPSMNVEAKLDHVNEAAFEDGALLSGDLLIRGPSIGKEVPVHDLHGLGEEQWVRLGVNAAVQTNGTFRIEATL